MTTVTHIYATPTPGKLSVVLWCVCMVYVRVCTFLVAIDGWPIGLIEGDSIDEQRWRSRGVSGSTWNWRSWDVSGGDVFVFGEFGGGCGWDLWREAIVCGVCKVLIWIVKVSFPKGCAPPEMVSPSWANDKAMQRLDDWWEHAKLDCDKSNFLEIEFDSVVV
jgi:hypothetical protein